MKKVSIVLYVSTVWILLNAIVVAYYLGKMIGRDEATAFCVQAISNIHL